MKAWLNPLRSSANPWQWRVSLGHEETASCADQYCGPLAWGLLTQKLLSATTWVDVPNPSQPPTLRVESIRAEVPSQDVCAYTYQRRHQRWLLDGAVGKEVVPQSPWSGPVILCPRVG